MGGEDKKTFQDVVGLYEGSSLCDLLYSLKHCMFKSVDFSLCNHKDKCHHLKILKVSHGAL